MIARPLMGRQGGRRLYRIKGEDPQMDEDALRAAVHTLLEDPRADAGRDVSTTKEAARAVGLLDEGLRATHGVYRRMAEGAQRGAETLSTDRLQALSEFVQNADDAGAGHLRFLLQPDALLIAHDGAGLRLGDVLLLGMPWLSGKTADARSTGRFGIGLSTLRALSTTWEVHGHPFHVRFADLSLQPLTPPDLPDNISGPRWTVFRIPLEPESLTPEQLLEWFDSWSDASLLFLRHLQRLEVTAGGLSTVLALSWQDGGRQRIPIDGVEHDVVVRNARGMDGALWRVYTVEVAPRPDWERNHKALGAAVPVAVALPLQRAERGSVHAGLPVVELDAAARIHSHFDPVASREGFADSRLNRELVPLVADLWAGAVRDVLGNVNPSAWHLIALPAPTRAGSGSASPDLLQNRIHSALLSSARQSLPQALCLPVAEGGPLAPLADFAVEEASLSDVLDDADTARLGAAPYAFPACARDSAGRWRRVLADWRTACAEASDLPAEVRVADALVLLEESQNLTQVVRLTAVAIETGHEQALVRRACMVVTDGRRLPPSVRANAFADVAGEDSGPLDVLGVVIDLHPSYWEEEQWSKRVIEWLRRRDCLVRRDDTAAVLRIAARLGQAGGHLPHPADPAQETARLVALQQALGEMRKEVRGSLGPDIGRAVRLSCFAYDGEGKELPQSAQPGVAYLSHALESADGDRFAVAARKTPGLLWVHRSYARSLLSAAQAGGLSRTAFLRLLGVADAPRLTPVPRNPAYTKRYAADSRVGLSRDFPGSSGMGRWREMLHESADYTLDDLISHDLAAVVANIAAEQDAEERRRRTAALLRSVAGQLTSPEQARVPMARANHRWIVKRDTAALWVWRLRDTPWLEDADGNLKAPADLTLRTPDTQALYGHEDPGYLHPSIQQALATRTDVFTALGVSGDPDVPQLMERLRGLHERSADDGAGVPDGLRAEALLVYRALARRLTHRTAETSHTEVERKIRYEFLGEALVLTDQGWSKADACYRGAAVLRGFRPFALTGADLDPLWQVLGIVEPGADVLIDVLKEISVSGGAPETGHEVVMLNALRGLGDPIDAADGPTLLRLRNRLRRLPLWTTTGWTKDRPVFAVDDPGAARALGDRLPLWQPGGDVRQFAPSLLKLLQVTLLDRAAAAVVEDGAGHGTVPADVTLTEDFRRGVAALQDLLVRNDPAIAEAFTGWNWLAGLDVRIRPGLRIRFEPGGEREPIELPVAAQIDHARTTLFLNSPEALCTKAGTGMAIAAHFTEEPSRVGHRWRDVWEEGLAKTVSGTPLVSAAQRDREDVQRLTEQLRLRDQEAPRTGREPRQPSPGTSRGRSGAPSPTAPPPGAQPGSQSLPGADPDPAPGPGRAPRSLVDPAELERTPRRTTRAGTPGTPTRPTPRGTRRSSTSLPAPRSGDVPPRTRTSPAEYGGDDKEVLVIDALKRILREEAIELDDQRGVSGLGADAVDSDGRYYEIKAHGRTVPGELTLTRAEFVRALTEGENYTLVIASHLEEGSGTPTIRLVHDPVHRFEVEPPTDVRLKGVRDLEVESTTYEWPAEE
ncbi:hypothetical protein [Streptomyces sp. A1547]|uniref:sacsin N-terminal ATP-binding-like domain-containing protein n=1 Tax=Streptomyces sp. A1547 TaxID=2563105 RepID=UPI00109E7F68|nr:hypothetical protein [Streptomyces sp. A1547]THA33721.1 hypothetical protein E6W17_30970 [Streptomyces sp. A1547]